MRIPVIAGNWKMNKNIVESVSLVKELKDFVRRIEGVDIIVCPPFTSLCVVKEIINGTNITWELRTCFGKQKGHLLEKHLP